MSCIPQAGTLSTLPQFLPSLPGPQTFCLSLPFHQCLGVSCTVSSAVSPSERSRTTPANSSSCSAQTAVADSWFYPAN